jgi:hypothetical protein
MARQSVVPSIRDEKLMPYLEQCRSRWDAQPPGRRTYTLPATADGKVNVRQLATELGLKPSQVQHFHNHAELADPVNEEARRQGLKEIGSRSQARPNGDLAVRGIGSSHEASGGSSELDRAMRLVSELQMALAEREMLIDRLRRENSTLHERQCFLEQHGFFIRT